MPTQHDEITLTKIESYVPLANKTVLEIGCGDGRVTNYLTELPTQLVACDPNLARLTEAANTVSSAHFLAGSGIELPFADTTFDLVLFTLSLHHHPDSGAALAEAVRVLRRDGHILVMEPCNDGELEQICNLFNDEGTVLANAQAAIAASSLQIIASELFATEWHYDDVQDLTNWLFAYYATPFDQGLVEQIHRRLGAKTNDMPLILEDKTIITCLASL